MKIVVAPDSFKGSLTAPDAARCIADGWRRVFPDAEIVLLPIADGGEGTLDALMTATDGSTFDELVLGPLHEKPFIARWGLCGDGVTAVVELAEAAGVMCLPQEKRDPKRATTHGVGELLFAAIKHPGVKRVIVGLGGSATNDGGTGLLSALGVRFLDKRGRELPPGGAALSRLATIDTSGLRLDPGSVELLIACDVDNPLCGPRGASVVFGPQKGASPDDVTLLDDALQRFADVAGLPSETRGAGAAGGTAYGLLWLFPRATLSPGIHLVLDAIDFDRHVEGAGFVVTGEGRFDGQTLGGKAIQGIAERTWRPNVPVIALVGSVGDDVTMSELKGSGIDAILPIVPGPVTLENAMVNAAHYLTDAAERVARLLWLRGFPE